MAARKRKKSTSKKTVKRRKAVRKPQATRRRRAKSVPKASTAKKRSVRRAPKKHSRARASVRHLIALSLASKAVVYFGGVLNRKPVYAGRNGALLFGNLSVAKDIAHKLVRLNHVKKVGVFSATDSPESIRNQLQAAVKKRKKA